MMKRRLSMFATFFAVVALFVVTVTAVFAGGAGEEAADGGEEALSVLATTGYIGDAVSRVAPDAELFVLVGPGLDPHTYEASTQDIERMNEVDIVLWNGLFLEAQMEDVIYSLGDRQLELAAQLPESLLLETGGEIDPHVWNSTEAWSLVVGYIADKLSELDPANEAAYQENAEAFIAEIEEAGEYAAQRLGQVPEENRVLVSGHDAFQYFANDYGYRALAIEGISTEDEASLQDLRDLADYIVENNVLAIFFENITNPQATVALQEAVEARGGQVAIAEETLYSDSLGDAPPVDTYLGVFRHNVDAVADALIGLID
jgi:manganese/zinc/iron transport system substrate-binding protein